LNPLSDNALMLKVKNGDLDKLGLLFERYNRPQFGFLFHMTGQRELSEDLVQSVFYRILKYKHTFRGDGEFKTWMYHMARNVVNDNGRSVKRTIRHQELTEFSDNIGGGFAADESIHKKQELATLRNAMANLSEESREVLILSKFQELKYNEIAQIMDITEGAVKVRVHRAISQLKNMYLQIAN
jgi:RNA polymerase sigma factor (sigma-70 family)